MGDEVIIAYMDNDIDKPFISVGAQEYGYNQLCFSNLKDNEEISLRAQKDYTQSINNNFSQTIHNNKSALNLLKLILESLMSFIKSWSKNLMKK